MIDLIKACDDHFGVFIVLAIFGCIIVTTLIKGVVTVAVSGSRERTRREIAAYVAEGSVSPDQGERLMKAQINGREVSV
ncbi:MAG: hypothetical protein U0575_13015 [Phycisphaerales bacterium]